MERAAFAAKGHCETFPDGSIKASPEWLYNYSRLLLKQACEARLRSLGTVKEAGAAVIDYLGPFVDSSRETPQHCDETS
jgi:hypothetical protein